MPDGKEPAQNGSGETAPIWTRVARASRGRRPSLTHADIAAAGVRLADRDGLESLSMRKLAGELGVGTMSLYRYVANKVELTEVMLDAIVGELTIDEGASGWRDTLAAIARSRRRMVRAHPWAAGFGSRPSLGPNTLAWIEQSTARLDRRDLTIDQVMDMIGTVTAFVTGFVQYERGQDDAQRASGLSEDEWRAGVAPYLRELLASGRHPYLERIVLDAEDHPDPDELFERRLAYVLDGIGAGLGLDRGVVADPDTITG